MNTTTYSSQKWWFLIALLTFMIQYVQPEEIVNSLTPLKPHLLCVVVLTLILFFSREDMFQLKYPQMKLFWLFVGMIVVLAPFAKASFTIPQYMIAFGVLMSSMLITIDSTKKLKTFMNILMFVTGYIVLRGFVVRQSLGGNEFMFALDEVNAANYISNPNDLAMFIVMMIPFIYHSLLNKQGKHIKILYATLLLSAVILVILTFSRGGFLGLAVVLSMIIWYSRERIGLQKMIILGIIFGLIISFFIGKTIIDSWVGEISTTSNIHEGTSQSRLQLWKASFNIFLDHPLGVGAGSTIHYMEEYSGGALNNVSHSIWFTTLAEEGLIGIFILVTLLWINFTSSTGYNIKDGYLSNFMIACNISLISFIVTGTFGSKTYYPHLWYLTALIIIGNNLIAKNRQRQPNS